MEKIRRAKASDHQVLTELACVSEAHWGFDQEYMRQFRHLYAVTSTYIEEQDVFLIESGGLPVAFYGLNRTLDSGRLEGLPGSQDFQVTLEYFYVHPDNIGKHYGRKLWHHLTDFCEGQGIKQVTFVTSPEAEAFYRKMGAVKIGMTHSQVKQGRVIPQMSFEIRTLGDEADRPYIPIRDH